MTVVGRFEIGPGNHEILHPARSDDGATYRYPMAVGVIRVSSGVEKRFVLRDVHGIGQVEFQLVVAAGLGEEVSRGVVYGDHGLVGIQLG